MNDASQINALPVGTAIRNRRHHLGLTLRQVAKESGLSAPFLSQLETNKASPSLASLSKIAAVLKVDIDHFMKLPERADIVRTASNPHVLDTGLPVVYHNLSGDYEGRRMRGFLVHVPAGVGHPVATREGEGLWYVLEGKLEMTVGRKSFVLGPGDSVQFDQRLLYSAAATADGDVRLIWVGTPGPL